MYDRALPIYTETLELMKAKLPATHPNIDVVMVNFGIVYLDAKQPAKAILLFEEHLARERQSKVTDSALANRLSILGTRLLAADQFVKAEEYLGECLKLRSVTQPDAWGTFHTQSLLGAALQGRNQSKEAEQHLHAGYEGLMKRESKIPAASRTRLPEAVDRLIAFYQAVKQPDDVAKWRTERAKYPAEMAPLPRWKEVAG